MRSSDSVSWVISGERVVSPALLSCFKMSSNVISLLKTREGEGKGDGERGKGRAFGGYQL